MLKTISPAEMKALELRFMQTSRTSGAALMEFAAAHVVKEARRLYGGGRVDCICGPGNNGGDGMAAMRLMAAECPEIQGVCWLLPGSLSPDARVQLQRLRTEAPGVALRSAEDYLCETGMDSGLLIDAMFGTGLTRPLEGLAAALCDRMNRKSQEGVPVLAVDIPSGLDGASGKVLGAAVHATETVTFHRPKPGLYVNDGLDFSGRIVVGDIGILEDETGSDGLQIMEQNDLQRRLPRRLHNSHKGSYGRLLIIAGSEGMAGAAALCAMAALRTGAGLVTVACPEEILPVIQTLCPCATGLPLPADVSEALQLLSPKVKQADAVAVGCGLGQTQWAKTLLRGLLDMVNQNEKPAVLDADGLNLLAKMDIRFPLAGCILTPHPAEAGRLLGIETSAVLSDLEGTIARLREKYGASIVLKGAASLLAAQEGLGLNIWGTPAMAKGGSGDVLTGVLGALLAGRTAGNYALNQLELLQLGCGLHGLAGMAAEKKFGSRGVLATDLCEELGRIG